MAPPATEPIGFPLDPELKLGVVVLEESRRSIRWGVGPSVAQFTGEAQPADDAHRANASGWNCRTHQEYEAQPAVDWYIPVGTTVRATMDGIASLFVITTSNPFDVYGVSRQPYLGNPDRAQAVVSAFAGPGGGKGVFVRVTNDSFVTEYAHLDSKRTVPVIPRTAWAPGFGAETDFVAQFAPLRDFQTTTLVATWSVRRGDVVGMSGDSGYSEAPHLHYTLARRGGPLLCPTTESGYADGGWLTR